MEGPGRVRQLDGAFLFGQERIVANPEVMQPWVSWISEEFIENGIVGNLPSPVPWLLGNLPRTRLFRHDVKNILAIP